MKTVKQIFRGSRYFEYMQIVADSWPGWHGGFYRWCRENPPELNVWAFHNAHDELRHATMLEF